MYHHCSIDRTPQHPFHQCQQPMHLPTTSAQTQPPSQMPNDMPFFAKVQYQLFYMHNYKDIAQASNDGSQLLWHCHLWLNYYVIIMILAFIVVFLQLGNYSSIIIIIIHVMILTTPTMISMNLIISDHRG